MIVDKMANPYQRWSDIEGMNYVITIKWGKDGCKEYTYGFNTVDELEAFTFGVEQSNGWMDYEVVEDE